MWQWSRALGRTVMPAVFLLFSMTLAAAPAADVAVRIEVRATGGLAFTDPVYVALVSADQAPGHPTREMVSMLPAVDLKVPPGPYGVMVASPGFLVEYRDARFGPKERNALMVELRRAPPLNGTVADSEGHPVAGARVVYASAAGAPTMSDMTPTAVQFLGQSLRTTTDENGAWHLVALRLPLLVEASGHAPAWAMINPALPARSLDMFVAKGASLHLTLDRADPAVVVSAVAVGVKDEKWHVPERVQPRIWGRQASSSSINWDALPPGKYRIVASYPDPERFSHPVEIAQATLAEGDSRSAHATLPQTPPKSSTFQRFLIPSKTDVSELRAFIRGSNELQATRWGMVDALAGKVVYIETSAAPSDAILMTPAELFSAPPDAPPGVAVTALPIPRGEGRLRVIASDGVKLPPFANVTYGSCANHEQLKLPVAVGRDGVIVLPLLVPCKVLTLAFNGAGAVAVPVSIAPSEQKWLGEFNLAAASSAEVHATFAHAPAAGAHLLALVVRGREKITLAEADADQHGVGILRGLPPGEVTIEARFAKSQLAGSATLTIQTGQPAVVDPLEIPEPASIVVNAEFDPQFRAEYPNATLKGIVIERESTERPNEARSMELAGGKQEASFDDVTPGRWHVKAWVTVDDMTQPIEVETVDVGPGDAKHVDAHVKPLVFRGQVVSHGQGVSSDVGIGDPPGPNAHRRDVHSTSDGHFKTLLQANGYYRVTVWRRGEPEGVDIGEVLFDASSPEVRIELPEGTLAVHVRSANTAVASVPVVATMRGSSSDGVTKVTRRGVTDANGSVSFENLQMGSWTVEARDPQSGRTGEKAATISSKSAAEVTVELADPHLFKGVVLDERGAFASGASVDCVYGGPGGILYMQHADANDGGEFSMKIAEPLPASLDCGVATAGGAIGAFVTGVNDNVELALTPAAGSVTIVDWGEKVIPDRFWLASTDGRVFNLSWAAKKFGKLWSPLTITRLPAGRWNVVRVDSGNALAAIARGAALTLPAAAEIRVSAGESANVHVQDAPRSK